MLRYAQVYLGMVWYGQVWLGIVMQVRQVRYGQVGQVYVFVKQKLPSNAGYNSLSYILIHFGRLEILIAAKFVEITKVRSGQVKLGQ